MFHSSTRVATYISSRRSSNHFHPLSRDSYLFKPLRERQSFDPLAQLIIAHCGEGKPYFSKACAERKYAHMAN